MSTKPKSGGSKWPKHVADIGARLRKIANIKAAAKIGNTNTPSYFSLASRHFKNAVDKHLAVYPGHKQHFFRKGKHIKEALDDVTAYYEESE